MATYIVLGDWTEQGVANFEETVDRYDAGLSQMEALGVTVKDRYWTLGGHDQVSVIEAPDDETLAAAMLKVTALGNIRTTTLRAFSADEMRALIAKTR
jgi:uncharacterized protein with GYD domain